MFIFVVNEFVMVDDSFVVSVLDGIGELVFGIIDLGVLYVSNEDKFIYYYVLFYLYIINVENMVVRDGMNDVFVIIDVEVVEDVYINIVVGYVVVGFVDLSL